ncbi:MAG: ABC transporter ATP-binding protein [Treponema sp.]|jgi:iron complex transport system ATP-binding protein|nr:ABC transporter ATP-binding protein [Treponema sp.]
MKLKLEELSAGFRGKKIIRDISFSVDSGELLVLAGPNGGGKTTLLKTIAGIVKPLSGRVLLDGKDCAALKLRERARRISMLFQNSAPRWAFTVRETVEQGRFSRRSFLDAGNRGEDPAVKEAILLAALEGYEDRPVTELSGGEYQRILIARSIAQGAQILLMDEPVNNLDPKYQIMALELVQELCRRGKSAVLSLHDLRLARRYAGRICLIDRGSIAALGDAEEVLQGETLRRIFEVDTDWAF